MKIIIDEREHALFSQIQLLQTSNPNYKIEKRVLELGDILIEDDMENILLIIERKSISDLLASIKDGRYEEQSYRLLHATKTPSHNILYLIEGMFSQIRSPQEKKIVLSAITSLNVFKGFSVIRTCSMNETAEFLWNMLDKIERDIKKGKKLAFFFKEKGEEKEKEGVETGEEKEGVEKGEGEEKEEEPKNYCTVVKKVKKENITKENMGEIILCQIPGISSTTAIAVMKYVNHSFPKLLEILKNSPDELRIIKIGVGLRKINKTNVDNMILFLL